ncbi:MAG: hypothetical protein JRC53_05940 [Deltaproteobacteria bacterium]|nr:hypothetical protein [Deltaproteobacteria bacterium]
MSIAVQDAPDYTGNVFIVGQLEDLSITGSVIVTSGAVEIVSSGSVEISGPLTTEGNVSVAINQSIELDVNVTNSVINIQGSVDANITNATLTIEGDVNVTNSVLNVNITNEVLQSKLAKPALAFNGENAYVEVPDDASLKGAVFTKVICFTVHSLTPGEIEEVVRHDRRWLVSHRGDKTPSYWEIGFMQSNGVHKFWEPSTDELALGVKHCTIIVADGSEWAVYHNGEKKVYGTYDGTVGDLGWPLRIGCYDGTERFINATVYWMMQYNRALTDSEIQYLFQNPQSPPTKGLVLWLNFDEGSGDIAYDKSGNGNHGTIYNAVWVSEQGQVSPLLAVNIAAKQVTLDINITAQDIDIKIYTPSGRWTTVSELMSSASGAVGNVISTDQEIEYFHLTGRGRLMHVGLYAARIGTDDLLGDTRLRIYIDGESSPSIDLSLEDIDFLNGRLLYEQMFYGFNRVDYGSDYWACFTQSVNPTGALNWARYDHYHDYYDMAGAFLKLNVEFTSELSIRVYNANTTGGVNVFLAIIYGEYL